MQDARVIEESATEVVYELVTNVSKHWLAKGDTICITSERGAWICRWTDASPQRGIESNFKSSKSLSEAQVKVHSGATNSPHKFLNLDGTINKLWSSA